MASRQLSSVRSAASLARSAPAASTCQLQCVRILERFRLLEALTLALISNVLRAEVVHHFPRGTCQASAPLCKRMCHFISLHHGTMTSATLFVDERISVVGTQGCLHISALAPLNALNWRYITAAAPRPGMLGRT